MKTRFLNSGLALALTLAVAAFGCGDKNKEKGEKGTSAGGETAGATTASAGSKTGFAVFPKDATVLIGVNLSGITKSPFWPMAEAQMASDPDFKKFVDACGFNPVSKIEQVLLAGTPDNEDSWVVVVKGFTRDQIKSCGTAAAKSEGKTLAMADEGNLTKLTVDGEDAYIAWLDDKTIVFTPAATSDSDDIAAGKKLLTERAAGKDGLDTNAKMMELLKNVDTSATVYAIGDLAAIKDAPMDGKAQSFFASLLFKDGLKIDAGVRFVDAATANQVLQKANGMKGMIGQMQPSLAPLAEKVKISVTDADLVVQANLSEEDLKGLQAAAGQMMPMMGGMPAAKPTTPPAP